MMENNIENLHPKGQVGIEPGANRFLSDTLDHYTTEVLLNTAFANVLTIYRRAICSASRLGLQPRFEGSFRHILLAFSARRKRGQN